MTLVEIMITLIISSIIAASTFMFFAGQQRIYETQTKILNIQQNVWAAMEVVTRYVRASGSGMYGCVRPANYANPSTQGADRLHSSNPSDGPVTSNLGLCPQTGVRAFVGGQMQWIPPLWIVNNSNDTGVVPNTDIVTVAFGNRTSGTDTDAFLSSGNDFLATTDPLVLNGDQTGSTLGSMFRAGEFVLLLVTPSWGFGNDPRLDRGCTMFQITRDPANSNTLTRDPTPYVTGGIQWNPGVSVPLMLPPAPGAIGLPTGYWLNDGSHSAGVRNFGQLTWVRFYIATNSAGTPQLAMRRMDQPASSGADPVLAEGIEDLQVAFACDTGTLGTPDLTNLNGQLDEGIDDNSKKTDEWWNNVPGDTPPAAGTLGFCNLPTAVRLTMVVRTLTPDDLIDPNLSGNGPLDIEDHRYTTRPKDQYRRRVLSTTVYPRNNKPL
jgi:type II secretory pathway pseudopilin PulG